MKEVIKVNKLRKYYRVYQKEPGFLGSIKGLWNRKCYDAKAVDDISFEIKNGELVGFIGPNGAGKTTTLKVLSGLLYPTSGEVSVLGWNPWERNPEFQKQFSIVMGQKNQLWWDLSAYDSFLLMKDIYSIPEAQFRKTVDELVTMLDLGEVVNIQVRKLSLGQRMKAELVAALLHSPKVLFLDEPTIGLDVVMQKKIRDFIKKYNKKHQATIILTSHYMEDVKELCERVIMIDHGRILFDGALSNIIEKFADHKLLIVAFEKPTEKEKLQDIGEVVEYEPLKAVIKVKKTETSEKASRLLSEYGIADLTIEESKIEDIIREIFTGRDLA